jgi:cell division protein ZapE
MVASAPGPIERYQSLVDSGQLQADPAQERIVRRLQDRFDELVRRTSWWQRLSHRLSPPGPVQGLYLHGRVGRGKTMLMNLFAAALAEHDQAVWRIHFHRFMDHVHNQLRRFDGKRDPLRSVADEIASRARVLCFDELHVGDIGDAMILGELLKALFERGVVLVATSNTEPDQLYADGLQRARFVPAIEAIKHHCRVVQLDTDEDYRLRELVRHPIYYWPDDEQARAGLADEFRALAAGEQVNSDPLDIRGHQLRPLRRAGSVAWFDFSTLCEGPRASADYIELTRRFGTLIISEVPQLNDSNNDATRRFIHLIDECYERAVKLIIAAEAPPEKLYTGKRLAELFERTQSRLIEMQSHDYLGLPHRA